VVARQATATDLGMSENSMKTKRQPTAGAGDPKSPRRIVEA
jgi:hypothetical protein